MEVAVMMLTSTTPLRVARGTSICTETEATPPTSSVVCVGTRVMLHPWLETALNCTVSEALPVLVTRC